MSVKKEKYYEFYQNDVLVASGSIKEIAEKVGMSAITIEAYKRKPVKNKTLIDAGYILPVYAFYRGDDHVASGTLHEIVKHTSISEDLLLFYRFQSAQERTDNALIKIEGDYVIQKRSADKYAAKLTNDEGFQQNNTVQMKYKKADNKQGKLDPYSESLYENMFKGWNDQHEKSSTI